MEQSENLKNRALETSFSVRTNHPMYSIWSAQVPRGSMNLLFLENLSANTALVPFKGVLC